MADDRLLYFAYGSNMCTRYLRDHCPNAEPVIPAAQYIDWMLEGAREHGLPDDYIARIAGFRSAS